VKSVNTAPLIYNVTKEDKHPRHFGYIDALRGIAILGVMAVHCSQCIPEHPGVFRGVINEGARGVQLFFVASALTLTMSWSVMPQRECPNS